MTICACAERVDHLTQRAESKVAVRADAGVVTVLQKNELFPKRLESRNSRGRLLCWAGLDTFEQWQ